MDVILSSQDARRVELSTFCADGVPMVSQAGSPLLSFRPLEPNEGDESLLAELNADPRVIDFLGSVGQRPDDESARIRVILTGTESAGVVGLVGDSELICALLPCFRGKGLGPRACRQFLAELRQEKQYSLICAAILPRNEHGLNLAKALGFLRTEQKRLSVWHGEWAEMWELLL
jgi:RimJ/RimL family protein N-acetyltransferase